VSSWLAYVAAALVCAQVLGINVGPLMAVGGASGIIVGLVSRKIALEQVATQATSNLKCTQELCCKTCTDSDRRTVLPAPSWRKAAAVVAQLQGLFL
jgi:hypothetical protein